MDFGKREDKEGYIFPNKGNEIMRYLCRSEVKGKAYSAHLRYSESFCSDTRLNMGTFGRATQKKGLVMREE